MFRVPTTSVGARGEGAKGVKGSEGGEGSEHRSVYMAWIRIYGADSYIQHRSVYTARIRISLNPQKSVNSDLCHKHFIRLSISSG